MVKPHRRFCSSALMPEYSLKLDPAWRDQSCGRRTNLDEGRGTPWRAPTDEVEVNVFDLLVVFLHGAQGAVKASLSF
jgi:hypothetical protein